MFGIAISERGNGPPSFASIASSFRRASATSAGVSTSKGNR